MAKRVRRFSISRNKQYETHQLGWTRTIEASNWNFRYGLERKVKSETFEYLATEYGSLKSIVWFFMIDLTSDGESEVDCIVTWF